MDRYATLRYNIPAAAAAFITDVACGEMGEKERGRGSRRIVSKSKKGHVLVSPLNVEYSVEHRVGKIFVCKTIRGRVMFTACEIQRWRKTWTRQQGRLQEW